ncbi:exostosin-like 3 [Tubulanus polymorphus]|uniref:exostosin-like 3 n=1 Tax=Tubulanus polymorphus TaxID=672921 RepID=UPI003DA4379F
MAADTTNNRSRYLRWLTRVRLSRIMALLLVVLVIVPLVVHYYISNIGSDGRVGGAAAAGVRIIGRTPLDHAEDPAYLQATDLVARVKELKRIHASVNNELRQLESKRQKLKSDLSSYATRLDAVKSEHERSAKNLEKLKLTIENVKLQQLELQMSNAPLIYAPKRVLVDPATGNGDLDPPTRSTRCRMSTCFDYSRCSLTSGFPVYFYAREASIRLDDFVRVSVGDALNRLPFVSTTDGDRACLYVVLIGETAAAAPPTGAIERLLRGLPYWRGDGRNHLLLNLAYRSTSLGDVFSGVNTGRAIVAQSAFTVRSFRADFDLVVPPLSGRRAGRETLPYMLPVRRKYLMSFQGMHKTLISDDRAADSDSELLKLEAEVVQTLKQIQQTRNKNNVFYFYFYCNKNSDIRASMDGEWTLCADEESRREILALSTFSLILAPVDASIVSTVTIQRRLLESIKYGAVPVVLGDFVRFPFSAVGGATIDWTRVAIVLPKSRITELHFYLRTLADNDIFAYRKNGRAVYEKYVGTTESVVRTILLSVRTRLRIAAPVIPEHPSPSVFNDTFAPLMKPVTPADGAEADDVLGPVESPQPSPKFRRNFTFSTSLLDDHGDAFHLYPFTPFAPVLPSDAKFYGSGLGFRPIAKGQGGSGKEFTQSLGGNYPTEQFTVVMLTYEREAVLVNAIERFKDLPYLNKVVVVWNSPRPPSDDLQWPDIGVKVHVVRTSKNSLNNRFLPYSEIETEAILSIDDDTHLRHDEIMFGFRVWRESRDRLVGFPGRFHSWEPSVNSWFYNSNYTCELSMVLTGAAFYHKYYAYLYTYIMPQAIRDLVDEFMNCEDLAMNLLVSHITQKPPIKVTSRWTFRCPGCPKALSFDDRHFQERHRCLNYFVKIYGYTPLLYTQFRVDSILFKTRIPHDKQKCFKFI